MAMVALFYVSINKKLNVLEVAFVPKINYTDKIVNSILSTSVNNILLLTCGFLSIFGKKIRPYNTKS